MSLANFLIPADQIQDGDGELSNEQLLTIAGLSESKEGEAVPRVAEAELWVEHGNYAKRHRPPCMPDGESRCATISVGLPNTAQIVGVELAVRQPEHSHWTICSPNADTPIGWSWFGPVQRYFTPREVVTQAQFKNWVHSAGRYIRMRVYYYL